MTHPFNQFWPTIVSLYLLAIKRSFAEISAIFPGNFAKIDSCLTVKKYDFEKGSFIYQMGEHATYFRGTSPVHHVNSVLPPPLSPPRARSLIISALRNNVGWQWLAFNSELTAPHRWYKITLAMPWPWLVHCWCLCLAHDLEEFLLMP